MNKLKSTQGKHDLSNMHDDALVDRIVSDEVPMRVLTEEQIVKMLTVAEESYIFTDYQLQRLKDRVVRDLRPTN